MTMASDESLRAGGVAARLIGEILGRSAGAGPNESGFSGLTTYVFTRPQPPVWSQVNGLAICCVLQGRKQITAEGRDYVYEPVRYLVFARGMRFQSRVLQASSAEPFVSFILQLDPVTVKSVSMEIPPEPVHERAAGGATGSAAYLSASENTLLDPVLRLLQAQDAPGDRAVLTPIYLREITYRLLCAEQRARLLTAAWSERNPDAMVEVIHYMREHISEQITVAELARVAMMSPSALSSGFAEATGLSPYKYLKRMRLDRSSELLIEGGVSVGEVAARVGYTSLSHFITEFRRRFGVTPHRYAATHSAAIPFRVDEAELRAASDRARSRRAR